MSPVRCLNNRKSLRKRDKRNRKEEIINKTIQEVFPEQKYRRFQNESVYQVPNTMDEHRPRNIAGKFLNTGDHWDQTRSYGFP